MNTQNVKTAAPESTERCGKPVAERQHSLLLRLCGVWNLQLSEPDEEAEIGHILMAMVENVLVHGVQDWRRVKPLIDWRIAQAWIEAQRQAVALYGKTGTKMVAYTRAELAISLRIEQGKKRGE